MARSDGPRNPFDGFRIEVDPEKVEEAARAVRTRLEALRDTMEAGLADARHRTVRITRNGRQIGPDLPLTVLLAGEGVALAALGPLWTILANLGARAVLEVEIIHAADELVAEGRAAYADGEVATAEARYRDALARRPSDPGALYHLAVLLRVTGRVDEARSVLARAVTGPPDHPDVVRAAELLARMDGARTL